MNELQYTFNMVCQSIGQTLKKVEVLDCNRSFVGNAAAFDILPSVASALYFVDVLYCGDPFSAAGGAPYVVCYDLAAAAVAHPTFYISGTLVGNSPQIGRRIKGFISRLAYAPNGCTSATLNQNVLGLVYKITYS